METDVPPPNTIRVKLAKVEPGTFGLKLCQRQKNPRVLVSDVAPGSVAAECGLVQKNDSIVRINEVDVTEESVKGVENLLRKIEARTPATFLLQCPDAHRTFLQTIFMPDGTPRTWRVSTPVEETTGIRGYLSSLGKPKDVRDSKGNEYDPTTTECVTHIMNREAVALEKKGEGQQRGKMAEQEPSPKAPRESPKHAQVKNLITGSVTTDILHQKAYQPYKCNENLCTGSLVANAGKPPGTPLRTKDEVLVHAKDFLDQYYTSIKRFNTAAHQTRFEEVREAIETRGTYELTTSELTFGAKTAWRNAARCIGRIQWSKLQVFDARHVTTASEMFEALCNHIKYATNKGNIRSAVTVFPPRTDGKHDFRVWNGLLIGYAGYEQPDGSIIGDPSQMELTQICQRMGWKGAGGMFDVLPLVLQANGENPEYFPIEPELVLEVTLKHPQYDWFEGLGLKWFAVPGVSNQLLDCGGLEFTAVPFSGWYMGTEIGARDLCDPTRYNMSEVVATKMGLDVNRASSLWKDRAIIEVNIAVLHSFQAQRVTITDHHSASESFIKHMETEQRLRGGTPGDWVWITPPISGSACAVFHQEMLKYNLKPSYEYQMDPWKTHVWDKETNDKPEETRKRRGFREVARAVKFSAHLMGEALARRIKCTILYATETGKSETYAKRLCEIFKHAFDPKVMPMEDYDVIHLEHEALVLYVTSTFGNGDPPENGEQFAKGLYDMMEPTRKKRSYRRMESLGSPKTTSPFVLDSHPETMLQADRLSNVRYSVFGLGSRAYPKFCAFAKFVDRLMDGLGGERIIDIGEGDELCGQEQSFQSWAQGVFKAACETFCVGDDVNMAAARSSLMSTDMSWAEGKFRLTPSDGAKQKDICDALSTLHSKNVKPCKMLASTNLQSEDSGRRTILLTMDTQGYNSELMYNPGDHVGIFPQNKPQVVDAILERLADPADPEALVQLEILREKFTHHETYEEWEICDRFPRPLTLRLALLHYLDLTTPPSPIFLKQLASLATDAAQKETLNTLASVQHTYEEWKSRTFPTLAEVLAEFPSVRPCATLVLSQLPLLQPRFYSISSSPSMCPGEIHLTVAVLTYRTDEGNGPWHYGVCSNWLDQLREGDTIPCFVRTATSFHMPDDKSDPMILVGPGTGIAPFRSFWQQRRVEMEANTIPEIDGGRRWGGILLYFGCRRLDQDNLHSKETSQAETDHVISKVHTALSRQPDVPKTYVQDILKKHGADIWSLIGEKRGHLYVCGDVLMAAQVCETLEKIIATHGHRTATEAQEYIIQLREESRFHEDIFGTLRMSDVADVIRDDVSKLPDVSELNLTKRRRERLSIQ